MEFLAEMEPSLRALWYIALPTSMIFLFQTILTFMGSDSGDGVNADFDGNLEGAEAPFQLFTLRNLINFLLGFSWTGITFYGAIPNYTVLILLSTVVGLGFVWLFSEYATPYENFNKNEIGFINTYSNINFYLLKK